MSKRGSLRVLPECVGQVKLAVLRKGFTSNQNLADRLLIAKSTVQKFLSGERVDRENFYKLCGALGLDWEQIADLGTSSDVPLPRPGELPENLEDISSLEPEPDRPKVLLTGHKQHSLQNQQLSQALEAAGQTVLLAQNWLQQSDDDLTQYDCFLLLVSNTSTVESISEQVQRVQRLRQGRPDDRPRYALIHVGAPISLPLNHPLHQDLQGVPQWEWNLEGLATFVQVVQGLLETELLTVSAIASEESQSSNGWITLLQELSQHSASRRGLLVYTGESQLRRLEDLWADLEEKKNRRIQSGYAYWGLAPVYAWERACNDNIYHMKGNILRFSDYARPLAQYVDKELYNFVSLGVGDGSKDRGIIADFFNQSGSNQPRQDFLYILVDMSLDMLRLAIENIPRLPLPSRVAIQRDIETRDGIAEIAFISKTLGRRQPILYGFIGNTISNTEQPHRVLNNVAEVMQERDRLLFEAQTVDPSALESKQLQNTIDRVKREYLSEPFRRFAESALLQNTDLSITLPERNRFYTVEVSLQEWTEGKLLQIDCFFENKGDSPQYMKLVNGQVVTLDLGERIRLYRSRKFTPSALQTFVKNSGFNILGRNLYMSEQGTGFMVMLLQREELMQTI